MATNERACLRVCRRRLRETARAYSEALANCEDGASRKLVESGQAQFAALKKAAHAIFEPARIEARAAGQRRAEELRRRAARCEVEAKQLRRGMELVESGALDGATE